MIYRLMKQQDDEDIPHILSIYKSPSISPFISINETNYWKYVTTSKNIYFYKVYDDNYLIATIHCELFDRILYMDIVVFPEYQRKGFATKIIADIQEGKLGFDFEKIRVSIDEKNIASLKLFEKMGFFCVAQNKELLEYEYVSRTNC